jgi:hypothetical protein
MILTRRETKTLLAVASVIIPDGGDIKYSYSDMPLIEFANLFLKDAPKHIQWLFRFNLWFIEYISWIFVLRPLLFSHASVHKRTLILDKMRNSHFFPIRGIYQFTSLLILFPFYNDKRVCENVGYFP